MGRALFSVSDKSGVVEFGQHLESLGWEIISTGGTLRALREGGVSVRPVSEVTEFPEMMNGRVKTLHPRIHGGILANRDIPSHVEEMKANGIEGIDLVVVNLYPFEKTVAQPGVLESVCIENIDIGGPCMLRAAAKNFHHVAVVSDPADYSRVLDEVQLSGAVTLETRRELAAKAFAMTARYDASIVSFFTSGEETPAAIRVAGEKVTDLRYGENPHQAAALYRRVGEAGGIVSAKQLQGKALSYNNLVDADAAYSLACELPEQGVAIIKHTNPCGVGVHSSSAVEAYELALGCDPVSAFGGIVALNSCVEAELATKLVEIFLEVIVAPEFSSEALEILRAKKNLRVLSLPVDQMQPSSLRIQDISGGLLLQSRDAVSMDLSEARVVTERKPSPDEWRALQLSWTVCKHVKSNAIVFCSPEKAIGVGAGQMSRIDAVEIAVKRARFELQGTAVGSDAFFPFRDTVDALARAGATAVVQPGGSIRDEEVIQAANELGLAMVFTGKRHFRH